MLDHDNAGEKASRIAHRNLREMVRYCETTTCRKHFLLAYFGEKPTGPACGTCDVCTAAKSRPKKKATVRRSPAGRSSHEFTATARRSYPIPSV